MSINRPRARQDGYITIIKEYSWQKRYTLIRNNGVFYWQETGQPVEIIWRDIYVSNINWGKKPKNVPYNPTGNSSDRTEPIGFTPSLSFKCALINKNLQKLTKFRTKYRVVIDYKDNEVIVYDTYEFVGCTPGDWSAGGDTLMEENVTLEVERLPDEQ